ncbi:MAG: hypothetical protein Q8O99_05025 [bacterium]|nr:hypothetical protein [bacterium]
MVTSAAGQSGQVVVVGSGSYTALCLVDGDTGVRCGNGWLDCDQIESLANTIGNSLAQQT